MIVSTKTTVTKRVGRVGILGGLALATLFLVLSASPSALAEPAHHPANFTVYFPFGTNQDQEISTNFRVSLIYGRVGAVRGLDLNAGVSLINRDFGGVQATGLYSQVGGDFKGIGLTGLVNNIHGDVTGVQVSGLVNFDRGHMTGAQFAPLFNFVEGGLSGVQVTSVFNTNRGDGGFLQLAAMANSNEGDFSGAQISGFNFTSSTLSGVQLGMANAAVDLKGAQVGLINIAGEAHGLQLGILNLSRHNYGVPIGLINLDNEIGQQDWVVFGSNLATIGTGVRTKVNRWYSILWAGYGDSQGDISEAGFLGWNYGYSFNLGKHWSLGVDLGYAHIMPESKDDPELNDSLHYALQARALVEVRLGRKVAVFAGGGISSVYSEYSTNAQKETEPNVVLGISLF